MDSWGFLSEYIEIVKKFLSLYKSYAYKISDS